MNKPNNFFDLPGILQESLLWDMNLDYDAYESSKAETIRMILCSDEHLSSINKQIINNSYKFMTEEFLIRLTKRLLENEEERIERLRDFIK